MRIAVIGVGSIGELHARIFNSNPHCELVAVCDSDGERARNVANSLGCRGYESYQQLLESEELDAASIATPETARHGPAISAARKSLAMLLEKPLGRTLGQVDSLLSELTRAGASPAVNFILHADPRFARMKQIVAEGGLAGLCRALRGGEEQGWEIEKYAPWTDLLSSTLIHDIDMALTVAGAPAERVYAEAVIRKCAKFGCHDAVVATMRFADGAVAVFETSWVLPPTHPEPLDPAFHLVGDEGSIVGRGNVAGNFRARRSRILSPDMTHWPMLPDGALARPCAFARAFVDNARKASPTWRI